MFQVIGEGKESSVEFYNNWVKQVKETVPNERLLIFSVKEGWKPLCDFLDVPVPNGPFPRKNDTAAMKSLISRGILESAFVVIGLPVIAGILYYYRQKFFSFLSF
jgi:hypothetical protein